MTTFLRVAAGAAVLALLAPLGAGAAPVTGITVPAGFTIEKIATVPRARELAVAPNGDLFVGTSGSAVFIVADAQGTAAAPKTFVDIDDAPVASVIVDGERMYFGAQFGVYELPYRAGDRTPRSQPRKIASVRTNGVARDHVTTTLAVANKKLYASVGSSCNNCDPDLDATRATIQELELDGSGIKPKARRIRNAIALTTNTATGTLWAGVAGQDELAKGHPYEILDAVTLHQGVADYGWPHCYENKKAADGQNCASVVVPRVVMPAYSTPIGAAYYPEKPTGAHAFSEAYRGGIFVALHGSWHQPPVAPRIIFVPMRGDEPAKPVNWDDPNAQWQEFAGGFQVSGGRIARPTGLAVGPDGSLFFSEDQTGGIYRIRPTP